MASKHRKPPRDVRGGGTFPTAVIAVFALALVLRLIYLGGISKSPAFHIPIIDAATYDQHARLLVAKGVFYQRFFWQGFFYPFFLAVVYFLTSGSMLAARLVQVALGSLLCAGVYRLGSLVFDRRTGLAAGIIAAVYGPLIFYDAELLDTGFSAIWAVVLMLLILKAEKARRALPCLLLGVCGGLSVVTRASFLPYLPVACLWLVIVWRLAATPWRPVAARVALLAVGFLAVTMPVAELCYRSTGDFSFLSESGPINLFIGNNPERDKTIMIRPGAEWRELTRMPMVKGSLSDLEDSNAFMHLFLGYVKGHPGDFVKGLNEKTVQFFSSRELPRNEDIYVARKYSALFSALTWKAGRFGFPFGLLLPLALLGIARHLRRIPIPVYAFLVLYPAAIIGVFVSGRYRIPVVPVLAVPAAAGVLYLFDSLKERRWSRAALIVGAVCAVAAASSAAGPFVVERFDYEAEMHTMVGFELMKQNRMDAALAELSEALRLDPKDGDAHKYVGLILSQERRHAEAAQHLRKALELEPDSYLIRYYLGVTLLNLGRADEAIPLLGRARTEATAAKEDQLVREIDRVLASAAGIPSRKGEGPAK